jgi:hypothetical protein
MSSFLYECGLQTTKQYEPCEMVLINHYEFILCCTESACWSDLLGIYYWVQYAEWALEAGLVSFLPWCCTLMATTLLLQLYNCEMSCFSDISHQQVDIMELHWISSSLCINSPHHQFSYISKYSSLLHNATF